jgi:hypothetical protein
MKTYQVKVQSCFGRIQTLTVQATSSTHAYNQVVAQGWPAVEVVEEK